MGPNPKPTFPPSTSTQTPQIGDLRTLTSATSLTTITPVPYWLKPPRKAPHTRRGEIARRDFDHPQIPPPENHPHHLKAHYRHVSNLSAKRASQSLASILTSTPALSPTSLTTITPVPYWLESPRGAPHKRYDPEIAEPNFDHPQIPPREKHAHNRKAHYRHVSILSAKRATQSFTSTSTSTPVPSPTP